MPIAVHWQMHISQRCTSTYDTMWRYDYMKDVGDTSVKMNKNSSDIINYMLQNFYFHNLFYIVIILIILLYVKIFQIILKYYLNWFISFFVSSTARIVCVKRRSCNNRQWRSETFPARWQARISPLMISRISEYRVDNIARCRSRSFVVREI